LITDAGIIRSVGRGIPHALPVVSDVSVLEAVRQRADGAIEEIGRIDFVTNHAVAARAGDRAVVRSQH